MKANELRSLSIAELESQSRQERDRLFRLRMLLYTNQLDKPSEVRVARKQVARIETILAEKRAA
jgi:large subunit ribosomal protein L29